MRQLLFILLFVVSVSAESISLSVKSDRSSYVPGDTFIAAVTVKIPEGFHLYANPLGPGVGKPLTVKTAHSSEITWIDGFSDQPNKFVQEEPDWVWQWDDSVHLFLRGIVNESAKGTVPFAITVDGLICKSACIPQNQTVNGTILVGSKGTSTFSSAVGSAYQKAVPFPVQFTGTIVKKSTHQSEISKSAIPDSQPTNIQPDTTIAATQIDSVQTDSSNAVDSTPVLTQHPYSPREASEVLSGSNQKSSYTPGLAILLALIAGFILNFMPCVLPVLGIKILAFSEGKDGSKATAIKNSLAFSTGMILVFMILATLAAFAGMSWGEQFQNPAFIVIMIALMFLFGMGMFDLFVILVPSNIANMGSKTHNNGLIDNFSKGVFATILATPCSGPFLGATLAWTVTQPRLTIYIVFLALGIGMASPYILLSLSRRLSRMIPKPGPWMEDFKHLLGFGLFGFAIYLMIGLPQDLVVPTIAFVAFLTASVILFGRVAPFGSTLTKKLFALVLSGSLITGGYFVSFDTVHKAVTQTESSEWENFTPESFEQAQRDGKNIVIDFTAVWCINCQFNKKSVYHTETMDSLIAAKSIVAFKGDMTTSNPELEKLRSELGGESVPFFAVFPANDPTHPVIFRDIVNRDQLFKVLKLLPDSSRE